MLATDPGLWGDARGAAFATLDECARPLPPRWRADPWRASQRFGEGGWQYGSGIGVGVGGGFGPAAAWRGEPGALSVVRRRLWYRTLHGDGQ